MTFIIYGLRLQGAPEVRYIGLTSHTPESRLVSLTRHSRLYGRRPIVGLSGWLLDNEGAVDAFEITRVEAKKEAHAAERAAVEFCLKLNHRLFNTWLVPAAQRLIPAHRTAYRHVPTKIAA